MRPAMSLAFTFTASTSFFTLDTSPFRQASNSSRKAPLALVPLGPLPPAAALPESGVDTALVALLSVLLGELALLLLELLLLELPLLERASAGLVGEAGLTSPSARLSTAAPGDPEPASSAPGGGDTGGLTCRDVLRDGVDSTGCCC